MSSKRKPRSSTKSFSTRTKGNHSSIGENHAKKCLKSINPNSRLQYNKRPDFLKNPKTGRNLELDIYDPKRKIAIEYDGRQHREYVPHFHRNKQDHINQVHRDKLKKKLCNENGIKLISINDKMKQEE